MILSTMFFIPAAQYAKFRSITTGTWFSGNPSISVFTGETIPALGNKRVAVGVFDDASDVEVFEKTVASCDGVPIMELTEVFGVNDRDIAQMGIHAYLDFVGSEREDLKKPVADSCESAAIEVRLDELDKSIARLRGMIADLYGDLRKVFA